MASHLLRAMVRKPSTAVYRLHFASADWKLTFQYFLGLFSMDICYKIILVFPFSLSYFLVFCFIFLETCERRKPVWTSLYTKHLEKDKLKIQTQIQNTNAKYKTHVENTNTNSNIGSPLPYTAVHHQHVHHHHHHHHHHRYHHHHHHHHRHHHHYNHIITIKIKTT